MVNMDEFSGNARKLFDSIEHVIIHKGILEDDQKIWEFKILGESIKINAEKLLTMGAFQAQYIKTFDYPAPKIKSDEWNNVLILLKRDKSEVKITTEESNKLYFARQLFDDIKKIQIDDDEELALQGKCLLKHDNVYYLTSKKIEELINVNGYKITASELSPVMHQLGMKTEGTHPRHINKKKTRVWEFYADKIDQNE